MEGKEKSFIGKVLMEKSLIKDSGMQFLPSFDN